MRICIFTTAHPFDDVRVYEKFCKSFLELGHEVVWIGPDARQTNRSFQGDARVKYVLFRKLGGKAGRLIGWWNLVVATKDIGDVDYLYAPDPDAAGICLILGRLKKAKIIFDIHENYHEAALQRWLGRWAFPWVIAAARAVFQGIASRCDTVVAVNDMIKECYAPHHPNAVVARNCSRLGFSPSHDPLTQVSPCGDDFQFLMHGKAETGRGTLQVLQALELIRARRVKVIMISIGGRDDSHEGHEIARLLKEQSAKIELIDPIPNDKMAALMSTCVAGLISYQRDLGIDSLPNRLFEYMAAGTAVIAPSYSREIEKIVREEGAGVLADFECPEEIAEAIDTLLSNPMLANEMGERGRVAFNARHNWESEFEKVNEALNRCAQLCP